MFRQPLVEGGVPVWFWGAVFEGTGVGGVQEVGAVEEGFGALGEEGRGWNGVGEGRGERCGGRWVVVRYLH